MVALTLGAGKKLFSIGVKSSSLHPSTNGIFDILNLMPNCLSSPIIAMLVNSICWNKAAEGGLGWVLDPTFSMRQ